MNVDRKAIKEFADDIRVIQNYTGNAGFDKSLLLVAPPTPIEIEGYWARNSKWFIKGALLSIFLIIIASLILEWVVGKHALLVFVIGMVLTIIGSCYLHRLYSNHTFTTIAGIGGLVALLVAVGVVSPQQISQGISDTYIPKDK